MPLRRFRPWFTMKTDRIMNFTTSQGATAVAPGQEGRRAMAEAVKREGGPGPAPTAEVHARQPVEAAGEPFGQPVPEPGQWVRTRGTTRAHYVFWSRRAVAEGAVWAARALAQAGVGPHDRVAIRLENHHQARLLADGAAELGAEAAWAELDGRVAASATVWITDPFTALAWPPAESVRLIVLTEGPAAGPALRARILGRFVQPVACREWYIVGEVPGPLAVECPRGALHLRGDSDEADLLDPVRGGPAQPGQMGVPTVASPFGDLSTGDAVAVTECGCGLTGRAFLRVLGRLPVPYVEGRPVYLADLVEALFRTPGFGGQARARIGYDRGRGVDYLGLAVTVDPGASPERVALAVDYSVTGRLGLTPRVEVLEPGGPPGVTLVDARVRP
jgi:hypothetical protein